jgi:hypothetical protein|tara:strand:+ start:397 stop:627 length:231 start_codon:yes stop_codon:yes gene_type:complete
VAAKKGQSSTIQERLDQTKLMSQTYANNLFLLKLRQGFSKYVSSGESFELIDGENLRIHDAELQPLMKEYVADLKK